MPIFCYNSGMFNHNKNQKTSAIDGGEVSTSRLETLTDGVFAIAMTILVLDIHVPELLSGSTSGDLFLSLAQLWPRLASFIISFIVLAMFWVAHHSEFRYIKKLDHKLIWLNMFYLLFVSLLPFTAALLGRYPGNEAAVIVYGAHLIIMILIHYFMWNHASRHTSLVADNLDPRINKLADRLAVFGISSYILGMLLSVWNENATLIIYALVPLPYIFGWMYYLV